MPNKSNPKPTQNNNGLNNISQSFMYLSGLLKRNSNNVMVIGMEKLLKEKLNVFDYIIT